MNMSIAEVCELIRTGFVPTDKLDEGNILIAALNSRLREQAEPIKPEASAVLGTCYNSSVPHVSCGHRSWKPLLPSAVPQQESDRWYIVLDSNGQQVGLFRHSQEVERDRFMQQTEYTMLELAPVQKGDCGQVR